jgi:hypothetical protein
VRGDIEELRDRYVAGDTSLTETEIDLVRNATNSQAWAGMVEARAAKIGIARITPGKTDAERAAEIREQMLSALSSVIDVMNDAREHGLRVGFQLSGADPFGRHHVQTLEVLKEL